MFRKKALLVGGFVAVLLLGGLLGYGFGQTGLKYPYLPAAYSERYTPTLAEWQALTASVALGQNVITDSLVSRFVWVLPLPDRLSVDLDTDTQGRWSTYLDKGRFACSDQEVRAAYDELAWQVMSRLRVFFPGIADADVEVHLGIHGFDVATWRGGVLKLKLE